LPDDIARPFMRHPVCGTFGDRPLFPASSRGSSRIRNLRNHLRKRCARSGSARQELTLRISVSRMGVIRHPRSAVEKEIRERRRHGMEVASRVEQLARRDYTWCGTCIDRFASE